MFVCLSLAGIEIWREWTSQEVDLRDAEKQTFNLAKSLSQHAEDTFQIADTLLVGLVERVETDGHAPAALARLTDLLNLHIATQPRLRGLFVYDEDGSWITSSTGIVTATNNNRDREYFRHHQSSPERGPFLGSPVKSRSGGQWIVTISRRLQHTDGRFAGVVLATIDVDYFSEFYKRFNVGLEGSIVLVHTKGALLARFPANEALLGRDLSQTQLIRELAQFPARSRRLVSPIDGIARISGYQQAQHFPILVQAAVGRDDVLANWRMEAGYRGAAVAALIALVGLIGLRLAAQVQRREQTEQALAESERRFRLLAENSSDIVSRIGPDGRRRYVSPASLRLLGYTPAELEARSLLETAHPDDVPHVAATIAALQAGSSSELTLVYRALHKDGREIWVEASLRVAVDPVTGEPDGIVSVARDVSQRKLLEAKLVAMARTDGLTGIANRRSFDEALHREWRRAARNAMPLSLILLDVDQFKAFNDRYGHQAGDQCLREVAAALAGTVHRSGDLVARYGGEEIVILLPETDLAAAMILADRARHATEKLRIPHERNEPSGFVTISAGVAMLVPDAQDGVHADGSGLVEAADRALYAAKAGGRNRTCVAFSRELAA